MVTVTYMSTPHKQSCFQKLNWSIPRFKTRMTSHLIAFTSLQHEGLHQTRIRLDAQQTRLKNGWRSTVDVVMLTRHWGEVCVLSGDIEKQTVNIFDNMYKALRMKKGIVIIEVRGEGNITGRKRQTYFTLHWKVDSHHSYFYFYQGWVIKCITWPTQSVLLASTIVIFSLFRFSFQQRK